jgi:hypothetical protein
MASPPGARAGRIDPSRLAARPFRPVTTPDAEEIGRRRIEPDHVLGVP